MKVLHLVRPESGPWEKAVAAHQSAAGDQVIVALWRDGMDSAVACDVLSDTGDWRPTPATTLSYDDLLDLLFAADQVYCW